jgi:two-component system nitrate/nitrite response regulator NarL
MRSTSRRLVFVDDHPALLSGLAEIFSSEPGYEVVGTGASANDALRLTNSGPADVAVIDLSMPGDVFAAIRDMTRRDLKLKIVVFTAFSNIDLALGAIDAGAHAFVLKGRPAEDLFEAIDHVLEGKSYVSPGLSDLVATRLQERTRGTGEA